jgi:hypothetical protein
MHGKTIRSQRKTIDPPPIRRTTRDTTREAAMNSKKALTIALLAISPFANAHVVGMNAALPPGTGDKLTAPTLSQWTHYGGGIAYLFAGTVTLDTPGAQPHTELAVGAQLNAYATTGSHQIVFGIATEAWAYPGSFSMLTGIEATTINMEADNPWRKIALWSTYKTRADIYYDDIPDDPANMNAQALRIESQPGTGFERGIVLSKYSLHRSRNEARPILIDLREVPVEDVLEWDLVAFPDGCRLRYRGGGRLTTFCPQ